MEQIVLHKAQQTFVFRYAPGDERAIDSIVDMMNANIGFTWLDGAAISHQIGMNLARRIKQEIAGMK